MRGCGVVVILSGIFRAFSRPDRRVSGMETRDLQGNSQKAGLFGRVSRHETRETPVLELFLALTRKVCKWRCLLINWSDDVQQQS